MSLFDDIEKLLRDDNLIDEDTAVTLESRLAEDLDLDSLDLVEVVMKLEETAGIEIPDEEAAELKTVDDVVKFLDSKGVVSVG